MSHLFISYSHTDDEYVRRLAQALEEAGFAAWVDDRIDYGTTWTGEVQRRLDACDAFILVMTPRSFDSRWVNNELSRAMRKNKPIFPLLLEGEEPWLAVESIQFLDVRGEKLPDERFYAQLATVVERRKSEPESEKVTEPIREPIPAKVAEPVLEPPVKIEQVEKKLTEKLPEKVEAVETKAQPAVVLPGKLEETKAVSKEVVKQKKKREKPGKIPKIARPVHAVSRKWMIAAGIVLGLVFLGAGAWLLREQLGLVTTPQNIRTSTHTSSSTEVDTPPPTTTAGTSLILPRLPIDSGNADQVGQVMQWGDGEVINTMVVNSTGERVAVGTQQGVKILDGFTLEVMTQLDLDKYVNAVTFTKDGNLLAVGSVKEVLVVDLGGSEKASFTVDGEVMSLSFSSYGTMLAAGMDNGDIRVWSMEDGSLIYETGNAGVSINVVLFEWSEDRLGIATSTGKLQLLKFPTNLGDMTLDSGQEILSLAFSPDGKTLAAGCEDGFIRLWDISSGTLISQLNGITHRVRAVAYSPDGSVLASGTGNGRIYLWKPVESDEPVATLEGYHTAQIRGLAFTPDGSLISAGMDGKVLRWDMDTLAPMAENTDFSHPVSFLTLSPDNKTLAYATSEGSIYLEDITGENPPIALKGPPDSYGIKLIDDGERMLTVSSVGILIEAETDSPVKVVDGFPVEVTSAAFHPDGDEIAVGFSDATIRFYDFSGNLLDAWSTDQAYNAVTLLEYSPDGKLLAAAYNDGLLVVWQEEEPLKRFFLEEVGVMKAMTFTTDSTILLMVGEDGLVRSLPMEGASQTWDYSISGLENKVDLMSFSPDGSILALGMDDCRIALVDFYEKKVLSHLEGHTLAISNLTWLPDASMLISTSMDGTVRFWGVEP